MTLVNLRRARKAKARAEREAAAATHRILHGRTRSERVAQVIETSRAVRLLDGHRLGTDGRDTGETPSDDGT